MAENDESLTYYQDLVATERNNNQELENQMQAAAEEKQKAEEELNEAKEKMHELEKESENATNEVERLQIELAKYRDAGTGGEGATGEGEDASNGGGQGEGVVEGERGPNGVSGDAVEEGGKATGGSGQKSNKLDSSIDGGKGMGGGSENSATKSGKYKGKTHQEIIEDLEDEKEHLENELGDLRNKHTDLIKSGDVDEKAKALIEELEGDLKVALEEAQKYLALYEKAEEELERLRNENTKKDEEYKALEEKAKEVQEQLGKAHYIIKRASEGGDSYLEDGYEEDDEDDEIGVDDGNDQISRVHTDGGDEKTDDGNKDALKTAQGFGGSRKSHKTSKSKRRRKMKKLNIKMLDKEVEAFLGDYEETKMTFAKNFQTDALDPIRFLLSSKKEIMSQALNVSEISKALDLLACLLGYESLDHLIEERAGPSTQKEESKIKDTVPKRKKWQAKLKKEGEARFRP